MTIEELSALPINSRVVFQRGNVHYMMPGVVVVRPGIIPYIRWDDDLRTELLTRNVDIFKWVELWDWDEERRGKMLRQGGGE